MGRKVKIWVKNQLFGIPKSKCIVVRLRFWFKNQIFCFKIKYLGFQVQNFGIEVKILVVMSKFGLKIKYFAFQGQNFGFKVKIKQNCAVNG